MQLQRLGRHVGGLLQRASRSDAARKIGKRHAEVVLPLLVDQGDVGTRHRRPYARFRRDRPAGWYEAAASENDRSRVGFLPGNSTTRLRRPPSAPM